MLQKAGKVSRFQTTTSCSKINYLALIVSSYVVSPGMRSIFNSLITRQCIKSIIRLNKVIIRLRFPLSSSFVFDWPEIVISRSDDVLNQNPFVTRLADIEIFISRKKV